jgi:hypothetical protein
MNNSFWARPRKPEGFGITFDFVIKRGNQTLRKLNAIPQRELHRISRELIEVAAHIHGRIGRTRAD